MVKAVRQLPLVTIAIEAGEIGGVPALFAYLFGVWLCLILFARLLARRLSQPAPRRRHDPDA